MSKLFQKFLYKCSPTYRKLTNISLEIKRQEEDIGKYKKENNTIKNFLLDILKLSTFKNNDAGLVKTVDSYKNMQKIHYEDKTISSKDIVGNYEWHENFPYETFLLYKNGDIRYPLFENTKNLTALDFGCGPGRMIKRMSKLFKKVDGCDISKRLLDEAKKNCPKSSDFYVTNGDDLGDTPKNSYDFVYCTISMQHICVHSIRKKILENIAKSLKKGGKYTFQLAFNPDYPYVYANSIQLKTHEIDLKIKVYSLDIEHANWFDDKCNADSTNGASDGAFGGKDLPKVLEELESIFGGEADYWLEDIKNRKVPHVEYWATHWIFVSGIKK